MNKDKIFLTLLVIVSLVLVFIGKNAQENEKSKALYPIEESKTLVVKDKEHSVVSVETEDIDFKGKIDALLEKSINRKEVLLVDSPEVYIWNLNTTEFLKGLMYETSLVLDFMSKNNKNKEKLREFNREYQQNTTCFSIILGDGGKHFDAIYELTLDTDEKKANYLESYSFLSYEMIPFKMTKEYLDLCHSERNKAKEHNKNIKNPII